MPNRLNNPDLGPFVGKFVILLRSDEIGSVITHFATARIILGCSYMRMTIPTHRLRSNFSETHANPCAYQWFTGMGRTGFEPVKA
jgi:NADH:ubiquinone oxidoreductase subunit 4 (subunit M)